MHTQCPKCRTIFTVTEEILAVKAGLVRCGDCDNVFNATWNLVDDPQAAFDQEDFDEDAVDSVPWHGEPEEPSTAAATNDEIPAGEFEAPHHEAATVHRYARGVDARRPMIDDTEPSDSPRFDGEFPVDDDTTDDAAMKNPLPEIDSENISDDEIRRTLRLDEDFDFGGTHASPEPATVEARRHTDGNTPDAVPAGGRVEPRLDAAPSGGLSVSADDALVPRRTVRRSETPKQRSPLRKRPAIQLKAPSRPARPGAAAAKAAAGSERADPNVHWVSIQDDRRGAQLLWASGVLVMLVLAVLQVRFLLVDELYSISATRPYIDLFCEFAGCRAPARSDPSAIDIAQTRVDLHPEVPGAMRIRVNLINRAQFVQPYPTLQVTLTDKDGRIVGRRAYAPADYLDGEGEAGDRMLDPGILAVASIDLAHPNENAVGFETEVVTPSSR